MTVKISCSGCGEKISVNAVFAGGMCRCPHCRSLVFVPGEPVGRLAVERPDVPPAPGAGPWRGKPSRRIVVKSTLAVAVALLVVAAAAILVIGYLRGQ